MATITYHNVGITAIAACVPKGIAYNRNLVDIMSEEEVIKVIESVGIYERRICDEDVLASDLCYKAAKTLMEENNIAPDSIDVLLFMSQTADYRTPATSCILQQRLGLSKDCAAIDLSLACSGYVYALSTAFAYASMEGINRVLLLDGEAFTKIVGKRDKVNVPLYGDAGTATLIEKNKFDSSTFILYTDGSGENAVKVPAGMRNKLSEKALVETLRENGNYRSDTQVYMDGMEVFNFAIRVVPRAIKEIVNKTGHQLDSIDFLIFHQSNKFMTDFFIKKLKFDSEKVPYSIGKYGNTSSASIPLTITSELKGKVQNATKVILCGFGAGLSWGTALIDLSKCNISNIVEY